MSPALADRDDADTTLQWSYTTRGQINVLTKEDGGTLTHTYDNNGRLTAIAISRATGVGGTTAPAFTYDGLGRMLSASDNNNPSDSGDNVSTTRAYDSLGRLIEENVLAPCSVVVQALA